jgi:vitellogenic carboxypeptidase-like protein
MRQLKAKCVYLAILFLVLTLSKCRECPEHITRITSLPSFTDIPCMYSGYITVDEASNSQIFYWLILSKENFDKKPLIAWLNGGPGSSSLFGLFTEMGPLRLSKKGMSLEEDISWTSKANIVYIDQPVGTGYSFTNNTDSIPHDEKQIAKHFYKFIIEFFKVYKNTSKMNFYLIGESYAGKYIPNIAQEILDRNKELDLNDIEQSRKFINLKKIAIGNGLFDSKFQRAARKDLALGVNILSEFDDEAQFDLLVKNCEFSVANNRTNSLDTCDSVLNFVLDMAGDVYEYDIRKSKDYDNDLKKSLEDYLNQDEVIKNIHVKNNTIKSFPYWSLRNSTVKIALKDDINLVSSLPVLANLLDNYNVPIVIYAGQFDLVDGPQAIETALYHLKHKDNLKWKESTRELWKIQVGLNETVVAGYVKQQGNLCFITMRNAGHYAPRDRIYVSLNLLDHLFTDELHWECPDNSCSLIEKKCQAMKNCSGNGYCDKSTGGICACYNDFFGPDCSLKAEIIKSNYVINVSPRDIKLYNLSHYYTDLLLEIDSTNHESVASLVKKTDHRNILSHKDDLIKYRMYDHKLLLYIPKEQLNEYLLVIRNEDYTEEVKLFIYINSYSKIIFI